MTVKTKPFKLSVGKRTTKTIRQGEPGWIIHDGMFLAQRAGFELSNSCPKAYRDVIIHAIEQGYLKPVATVREHELTWEMLNK